MPADTLFSLVEKRDTEEFLNWKNCCKQTLTEDKLQKNVGLQSHHLCSLIVGDISSA